MRQIINQLLNIFTPKEKRQFLYMVLPLMSVTMLFEIVGVMAIMPFMALVLSPETATDGKKGMLYHFFNFHSVTAFTIFFGLSVVLVLIIRGVISMFTMWFMLRFAHSERASLTRRLLSNLLKQPYSYFLTQNSSRLTKILTAEVTQITNMVIVEGAMCFSAMITIMTLITLFLIVMPYIAGAAIITMGAIFSLIFILSKKQLNRSSEVIESYESYIYQSIQECFGGIKEIKLRNQETSFIDPIDHLTQTLSYYRANADIIGITPKYAIEMLGYSSIIIIILVMLALGGSGETIIPKLAMFAFAGIKLMPALQQVFRSIANIYSREQSINALFQHLHQLTDSSKHLSIQADSSNQLALSQAIRFVDVNFHYPNTKQPALADINLTVPAQQSLGIVGPTGSGKSTLVDLLLGLLKPDNGVIYVDDQPLDEGNIQKWQNSIGYVPQDIYLTDRTIKENIAFGTAYHDIDEQAVVTAARSAHIDDFIQRELPQGYDTIVGERGIRLSGGQKQRLGIARALYHNPHILVLDEATSALDPKTEHSVLRAINSIAHNKTTILVTHRLSTVKDCDKIVFVQFGKIQQAGSFDELCNSCESFRIMADSPTS